MVWRNLFIPASQQRVQTVELLFPSQLAVFLLLGATHLEHLEHHEDAEERHDAVGNKKNL